MLKFIFHRFFDPSFFDLWRVPYDFLVKKRGSKTDRDDTLVLMLLFVVAVTVAGLIQYSSKV